MTQVFLLHFLHFWTALLFQQLAANICDSATIWEFAIKRKIHLISKWIDAEDSPSSL